MYLYSMYTSVFFLLLVFVTRTRISMCHSYILAEFCCISWNRQVSIEEGEGKAKDLGVMFIKTSAKGRHGSVKHWGMLQKYKLPTCLWEDLYFSACQWPSQTCEHALFRKIAAALPGMETLSSAKQEDMVDVNLRSGNENSSQSQVQAGESNC